MRIAAPAIILSTRSHGEHGAIVRALTEDHGLQAGYVRGGTSRRLRPVLQPGNLIEGEWRARTGEQLAGLTVEPVHSRAVLHGEPIAAAGIEWATALGAVSLPERHAYPHIYRALDGVLGAIEAAPAARDWAAALVRYELVILAELGFGLDLTRCAVTGDTRDLVYVSPRTGRAVSQAAAMGHEARLLPLPGFLSQGGGADWADIFAGLAIAGHFLTRDILVERRADPLAARARLIDRLKRAVA